MAVSALGSQAFGKGNPVSSNQAASRPTAAASAQPDPCQDFIDVLENPQDTSWRPMDGAYLTKSGILYKHLIWRLGNETSSGARCRRAIGLGAAGPLLTLFNKEIAAGQPPTWPSFDLFFPVLCSLHPDAPWAVSWMIKGLPIVSECLAWLAELPAGSEAANAVDSAIQEFPNGSNFYLQSARLSPLVRSRLASRIDAAYEKQDRWYRAFWEIECTDKDGAPSIDPAICSHLPPHEERSADGDRWPHRGFRALQAGLVLLPAAGIVALEAHYRHDDAAQAIAIVAGTVGGALTGGWLGYALADVAQGGGGGGGGAHYGDPIGVMMGVLTGVGGAVAGAALTAHYTESSPGARVGITAASMAVISAFAIDIVWN